MLRSLSVLVFAQPPIPPLRLTRDALSVLRGFLGVARKSNGTRPLDANARMALTGAQQGDRRNQV